METTNKEILGKIVSELLEKMGFHATVNVQSDSEHPETLLCDTRVAEDQNFLIGQYGVNLAAVQHIVRVLTRKQIDEKLNIVVDVNDYFAGKKSLIEKEAQRAADEALQNNMSVAMRPMLPYERKIVHAYLTKNPNITTESTGKSEERKVMVSPKPALDQQAS